MRSMVSRNQMHGKTFENLIKGSGGIFRYATSDRQRSQSERFDIDGEDDHCKGYPTSIKSTGSNTVGLSDARAFWQSFSYTPYRIVVGKYEQLIDEKVFNEIHEVIIRTEYREALLGQITESKVTEFHDGLRDYGAGKEQQRLAQIWAKGLKQQLSELKGVVELNPKIDSKNQRRLQCSIQLALLRDVVSPSDYTVHKEKFNVLGLPIRIVSGSRRI